MTEVIEGQRNFTVEEYHRMGEAGVFGPDERVELIWGVVREMSPKGRRHSVAVGLAMNLFVRRLEGQGGVSNPRRHNTCGRSLGARARHSREL